MLKKMISSAGRKIRNLVRRRPLRADRGNSSPETTRTTAASAVAPVELLKGTEAGSDAQGKVRQRRKKTKASWTLDKFQVPQVDGKKRFHDFAIPLSVMRAIADQKFKYCTPVQEKSLEVVLAGKDLVGKANTGTGKTAVFLIAILSRLSGQQKKQTKVTQALVLAPTRELVVQITRDAVQFAKYTNLSVQAVYGGVDYRKQLDILRNRGANIIVATPGRLLDFLGKGVVDLRSCSILILDEADRMLDMGFIPDVRRIVGRLPNRQERQTMLFSATVPEEVVRLSSQWCVDPELVEAEEEQVAADSVDQLVYLTTTKEKFDVLYNLITSHPEERFIVFANMKNETKRLADRLKRSGVECLLLSGDVAQNKRMSRLENFRSGHVKILVATDVAGRGIHIEGIKFVINYTLPYEPEDYVHRIGRTGRAGANGRAISFACEEGAFYLPAIEKFIDRKLPCQAPEEELLQKAPQNISKSKDVEQKNRSSGRRHKNRNSRRRPQNKSSRSSGNDRHKG